NNHTTVMTISKAQRERIIAHTLRDKSDPKYVTKTDAAMRLGVSANKLNQLIGEYTYKRDKLAEKAGTEATLEEVAYIIQSYINDNTSISALATRLYRSTADITSVLKN